MNFTDRLGTLSYEYVHDTIFRKLLNTCVKYRNVLPEMRAIENAILSADHQNYHQLAIIVMDTLKTNSERSRIIQEIFDNIQRDFSHGLDSSSPRHEGKYYIDSVTATDKQD